MQGLTKKQREIIDFITSYATQHRFSPSYRDIQNHFGFSSLGTVFNHIQSLKKKGFLPENTQQSRSLTLVHQTQHEGLEIPLIGKIRGGMPIETFAQMDMYIIPSHMAPSAHACYLLKVEGRELEEEWILAGDLLLVQSKTDFEDDEMVLIQAGGQTTFIKRAVSDPPYIRLESVNPQVQPLILREDHVNVLGIVLSLIRNYSSKS